ncbi:UDP-N,N'-diacetylbacillosamine 2-epimerase (hydrolyzing) [Poriferisphaera corsica]|uniref:UDP-N,N'-diacetylbacillosamine 2-epimerase (Hydrolyzing) n=1 Tax=Poriferisphaera corsica TaxID=2528020 RepID=A0A517YYW9_9BACT|nr:UDP-N-acetylglucosamine 2-epimerase [Poriferisphaera corsica]QDU35430.1 UDP-N,N'-diacetylbacillosamine 2-epimerase (hydrolyzing) [Poriferisphaera corsica]
MTNTTRPTSKQTKYITVVTGTRAEFGLLRSVIAAISAHPKLQLRLIAAGQHLTTGSYKDILKSDFQIDAKVRMQTKNDSGYAADAQALARGIASFATDFASHPTHLVLVLGDRIEAFAAASAAAISNIHLAHIHGGDRAEGIADESMRHAITKLAHIHFPASKQSATRIRKLGELPSTIHLHGSPSIDDLVLSIHQIESSTDIIVLQHPVGDSPKQEQSHMAQTLSAARKLAQQHNFKILILSPNADPGTTGINTAIDSFMKKPQANRNTTHLTHLPRPQFLAHLKNAKLILGNSSAALIEAAALKTPAVNIGPRQNGREKPRSVIDSPYGIKPVLTAADKALTLNLSRMTHPYGSGNAGLKIAKTLANLNLKSLSLRKQNTF